MSVPKELMELLRECDHDADGRIDFDVFTKVRTSKSSVGVLLS